METNQIKTEFAGRSFDLKYLLGSTLKEIPAEILELRRKSFVVEAGIMAPNRITTEDDFRGVHTLVFDKVSGQLVAAVHSQPAAESMHFRSIPRNQLQKMIYAQRLTIDSAFRGQKILPFILMAGVRPYRNLGYKEVAYFLDENNGPVMRHYNPEPLPIIESIQIPDIPKSMFLNPYSNSIEYWDHIGSKHSGEQLKDLLSFLYLDDIELALKRNVRHFNEISLWKKARNRSLRKIDWIQILSGLHQYVRFTTRTLAWAVGSSEDAHLRNSYIHHLKEEIDHERIIEDDLKNLGADLDFYVNKRPTCPEAMMINSLGDSLLLARRQPHLYLAIPFMLEGTTAHLERNHLVNLLECIQSWGIEEPEFAAQILVSHVDFDSGETGHHVHSFKMIQRYIVDEKSKSDFITIMNIAYQALDNLFSLEPRNVVDATAGVNRNPFSDSLEQPSSYEYPATIPFTESNLNIGESV